MIKPKESTNYKVSNAPNRNNNRSINDLTITLSLTPENGNIFSHFLHNIGEKIIENRLSNSLEKVKLLDIGCGQGTLLEDIIDIYDVKGMGIGAYNERDDNHRNKKAEYHQHTLIDKLPNNIKDNSLDFVLSLYSLQYIEKALDLIQDIYMKLKIGGEAILSLGTIGHIDPYLLQQIEEKNRNIIINSTFTGDINEKELLNSSDIDNNIREYKNKSHRIHILYIKKTSPEKKFYIPPYQSTKKIRISQQQRKKYINDYQGKHYEILSDKRMDPDNDYIHDSSENLRELSYTFINKDFFNHYLSNAK